MYCHSRALSQTTFSKAVLQKPREGIFQRLLNHNPVSLTLKGAVDQFEAIVNLGV